MGMRRRCSECRRTFTPSPRARSTQRVCCVACRAARDRRLAQIRRRGDLDAFRADERERQRNRRLRRRRSQSTSAVVRCSGCHALSPAPRFADLPEDLLMVPELPVPAEAGRAGSHPGAAAVLRREWHQPLDDTALRARSPRRARSRRCAEELGRQRFSCRRHRIARRRRAGDVAREHVGRRVRGLHRADGAARATRRRRRALGQPRRPQTWRTRRMCWLRCAFRVDVGPRAESRGSRLSRTRGTPSRPCARGRAPDACGPTCPAARISGRMAVRPPSIVPRTDGVRRSSGSAGASRSGAPSPPASRSLP